MLPVIRNSADAPSDRPPASTSKVSRSIGSAAGMPCRSPVVALIYEPFMGQTLWSGRAAAIGISHDPDGDDTSRPLAGGIIS